MKAQVKIDAIVSGEINKRSLEKQLQDLYTSESKSSEFKFHQFPTHIFIFFYTEENYILAGMGQWIATLRQIGAGTDPVIDFNERQLEHFQSLTEEKFGLIESQRKEVFNRIVLAERKASEEADGYYPLDPSISEQVGQVLTLSRSIPLMPSIALPSDENQFHDLVKDIKLLDVGSQILVAQVQKVNNTNWYLVEARSSDGNFLGKGWINGIALIGQTPTSSFILQVGDNQSIKNNLLNEILRQISQEFGISIDQINEIKIEAIKKDWSFPKLNN